MSIWYLARQWNEYNNQVFIKGIPDRLHQVRELQCNIQLQTSFVYLTWHVLR